MSQEVKCSFHAWLSGCVILVPVVVLLLLLLVHVELARFTVRAQITATWNVMCVGAVQESLSFVCGLSHKKFVLSPWVDLLKVENKSSSAEI